MKWGLNPNSSSLGVDVTFLLFGAAALAMTTPIVGALLRWRRPVTSAAAPAAPSQDPPHETPPPARDPAPRPGR
ncbi:MAG: hypothetical protein AAGC55_08495 [Myxococcota bacterium]